MRRDKHPMDELDDQVREHLEFEIQEFIDRGLSPDEARRAALRKFGSVALMKEDARAVWVPRWVDHLRQDAAYGMRTLRRNPGFAIVAILSLALGIGANAAIFQLINAVRLQPLPVSRAGELAAIRIPAWHDNWGMSDGDVGALTLPLWEEIREHHEPFSGVFAWGRMPFLVGAGPEMRQETGLFVSGEAFPVLGLVAASGRLLEATDDVRGCEPVGVLSHAFWQGRFGADPAAVGRTLMIFDQPVRIVGVTPAGFSGLEVGKQFDVAMPICALTALARSSDLLDRRDWFWLSVMGRLQPGWTVGRAAQQLDAMSPAVFEATLPSGYEPRMLDMYRQFRLTAVPAANGVSGAKGLRTVYGDALWFLLVMTGTVLLVACLNLMNLMLARATTREQEIAVRLALGASRTRVVGQLLVESLLLAAIGATLGALIAQPLSRGLVALLATEAGAPHLNLPFDWRMVMFGAAAGVLTSLAFGLVPALRASAMNPGVAMKAGGRGGSSGPERLRTQRSLIAGQVALSVVILVGAILFVRTFVNLNTADAGLRRDGILLASFADFSSDPSSPAHSLQRAELLERIRSTPGVAFAAATSKFPLDGGHFMLAIVAGAGDSNKWYCPITFVSPQYFETLGMRVVTGRDFTVSDAANTMPVALVSETFLQHYAIQGNPVGTSFRTIAEPGLPETSYTIVGVVNDAKDAALRESMPPAVYVPLAQNPIAPPWPGIVIQSSAPAAAVIASVTRTVSAVRPNMATTFTVLDRQVRDSLLRERLLAWLSGGLGALATLLALIGVYGVVAYFVVRRRHEIGIRLALGATRQQMIRWVFREILWVLTVGLAVGAVLSLVVATAANDLLFGLSPRDPITILVAVGALALVALLATAWPAVRASAVDPLGVLRSD